MGIIKTLLVLSLIIMAYLYGHNAVKIELIEKTLNHTLYKVNGTTCFNYTLVEVEKAKYNLVNITSKINLTESQEKQIKNLNGGQVGCATVGCSEGAIKMKYAVFDILGYDRPKFSERPSIGYNKYDNRTYLPVETDAFGEYIKMKKDWYIWRGANTYNLSILCHGNNTWVVNYERTKFGSYDINKTYTLDNLSFLNNSLWMPAQGNQLYLRHV